MTSGGLLLRTISDTASINVGSRNVAKSKIPSVVKLIKDTTALLRSQINVPLLEKLFSIVFQKISLRCEQSNILYADSRNFQYAPKPSIAYFKIEKCIILTILGVRSLANASRARQFNPLNPLGWVKCFIFFKVRVKLIYPHMRAKFGRGLSRKIFNSR